MRCYDKHVNLPPPDAHIRDMLHPGRDFTVSVGRHQPVWPSSGIPRSSDPSVHIIMKTFCVIGDWRPHELVNFVTLASALS